MPLYSWEYTLPEKTGIIDVERKFADYRVPPTAEEVKKILTKEEFETAKWEKLLVHPDDAKRGGFTPQFGTNWGPGGASGSKGLWGK